MRSYKFCFFDIPVFQVFYNVCFHILESINQHSEMEKSRLVTQKHFPSAIFVTFPVPCNTHHARHYARCFGYKDKPQTQVASRQAANSSRPSSSDHHQCAPISCPLLLLSTSAVTTLVQTSVIAHFIFLSFIFHLTGRVITDLFSDPTRGLRPQVKLCP